MVDRWVEGVDVVEEGDGGEDHEEAVVPAGEEVVVFDLGHS